MTNYYIIRPYGVGSKSANCLAMVIPAPLRKLANIDASTILMAKIEEKTKRITLQSINEFVERCENVIPAVESLPASTQQVSLKIQ